MPIEHELGTLIRRMNPYTNGTRGSMLFGSPVVAPPVAAALTNVAAAAARAAAAQARQAAAAALAAAAAAPTPVALTRARAAADAAIARAEAAANAADPLIDLAHIDLVIDDFYANYSSVDWVFRGQPQSVKRALRVAYRYPLVDPQRRPIGPYAYATEHILVGYAGGNSSG